MRKHLAAAAFLALVLGPASAQTLFTVGTDSVSVTEFLTAYKKNNLTQSSGATAVKEYLNLYIASRLKIREARERGYDTLPQLAADLQNLRAQILPAYLADEESVNSLVQEAFVRGQKDIRLAHIFIAAPTPADTAAARTRAYEAYGKLQKGEAFGKVAAAYSDDPAAKGSGGELGYITAFTLPYALESLAYNTPTGKFSPVFKSRGGYHIFKNLGERKALGRLKAAQILLAFPPGSTETLQAVLKKRADSLYNRLLKGDDFARLASQFSNDVITAASGGVMTEFGVGDYSPAFEVAAFALTRDGALSKPFRTGHGWHIVKRLSHTAAPTGKDDPKTLQLLRAKVEASDRINTTKEALAQKVLARVGVRHLLREPASLWTYTDSVLDGRKPTAALTVAPATVLLQVGDQEITAADWTAFAHVHRYKTDGTGLKPYEQVWEEFVRDAALNYYSEHLEAFNPEFRAQMEEFRDGNLFFEIMQRQVWGPAQSDTAALEAYYRQHKDKYVWQQSADAVVFYASDAATAEELTGQLKKDPGKWRQLQEERSERVALDSNRFELSQLPNPKGAPLTAGTITVPLVNDVDNSATFALVLNVYTEPQQRSFAEAKGLVINDYQADLEKKWIEELKTKYPVRINEAVLADVLAKK